MSKSTPIAQLPMGPPPTQPMTAPSREGTNNFINDQQRNLVQQAQQAQQNFSMPQNSQLSADVGNDDDATFQEVLNHLNSDTIQQPRVVSAPLSQQAPQHMMHNQNFLQNAPQGGVYYPEYPQGFDPTQMMPQGSYGDKFTGVFSDAKSAFFIAAIVFVVLLIPIGSFIGKYIPLDKIPHSYSIVQAILIGFSITLINKYY
jgi:hypothetical protein